MYLDATNKSVELLLGSAPATNQAVITADWGDNTATTYVAGDVGSLLSNGTTAVTVVPAPAASTQRVVKHINVLNADTAQMTVTIRRNIGGTFSNEVVLTILPGERIQYNDSLGFSVYDATGAIRNGSALSTVTSLKNLLINGSFRVNQRVFAGGALAAGVYGYDRWKAGTGGCNVTVNGTTFVVTHTSGPLVQVIESPRLAAQVVTVSVENPSGSISVDVDGQTGTITAGTGRRSTTVTVPVGSTGNVTLTLTATGVTYSDVQLERGPFATAFEVLPRGVEFGLCQRYYEKSYSLSVAPGTITNTGLTQFYLSGLPSSVRRGGVMTFFSVAKRAAPAVTLYSPATGATGVVRNFTGGADIAASAGTAGQNGFSATTSADFAIATEANFGYQYAADAEI